MENEFATSGRPSVRWEVSLDGATAQPQSEKVFVSWGNKRTREYDQYMLWIGKESGIIEATTFTTRAFPQPAPVFMYGSVRFDDFREVNGVLIPFLQTAQLGEAKPLTDDYVHQVTLKRRWPLIVVPGIDAKNEGH